MTNATVEVKKASWCLRRSLLITPRVFARAATRPSAACQ